MDTIEATKMVMSRIQNIDPENASKIMGYILIQDKSENEIIRLAFGPENLLASVVKQAKSFLDISSNTLSSSPSSPSPSPFSHPRIVIPNNGFHHMNPSPHSPWSNSSGSSSFQDRRSSPRSASYASVVNNNNNNNGGGLSGGFYNEDYTNVELVDDVYLGGDEVGGWKPCMYYARGFCKNGSACSFVHGNGGFGEEMCMGSPTAVVGSPNTTFDGFEDFLRMKAIQQQQQRVAAMAAAAAGSPHHFPFNGSINFLNDSPRSPSAAAMMMGEDIHKFGRFRPDRHDLALAAMGLGNSSSRQIYLTFPADSTFKEEDVSNYFSIFGPVQDVRIPYQQKRMFGFVTFVLPETVKAILAKGNPHFVCDSRVLVKPYKEKGKIPDKKHHQHQIERGDFSALESAEPFDHIPFGARMFNHDMMLRRKLEDRAELQQAIEIQERSLMNMQLTATDHQLSSQTNQSLLHHNDVNVVSGEEVNGSGPQEVNDDHIENNSSNDSGKESPDLNEHQGFFDHILPDNLFASPTKTAAEDHQSTNMPEADNATINQTSLNMKSCYFQMPRSVCGQEASH